MAPSTPNGCFAAELSRGLFLTAAAKKLAWQDWGDVFIVYQPSSAETHVFNDTTVAVLQCLQNGSLTIAELADQTTKTLDIGSQELSVDDLSFAVERLDELGLIEWLDEAAA